MTDNRHSDMNDDEIRIVTLGNSGRAGGGRRRPRAWLWAAAAALVAAGGILAVLLTADGPCSGGGEAEAEAAEAAGATAAGAAAGAPVRSARPFAVRADTTVNGVELSIITPYHAQPQLAIGDDVVNDSAAVLIAQAADIRGDNGGIVGTFVVKGELVSKGESKAGFCSIINGEITVGVADATPMLEQALTADGYFFRQYPLVVGGQVVENKLKGRAMRRALAEIDGRVSVVASGGRLSLRDFSQALADLGARNAIYLVGGRAYGSYTDPQGERTILGEAWEKKMDNVNYIVWR